MFNLKNIFRGKSKAPEQAGIPYSSRDVKKAFGTAAAWMYDGEKYEGGFGDTNLLDVQDYYLLRLRSRQLFSSNPAARGIIRRMLTNEVHTGLQLEATPSVILGLSKEEKTVFTDDVEARFKLWSNSKEVASHDRSMTFPQLEEAVRMEALVGGDCLVVLRHRDATGTISVELVNAERLSGRGDGLAKGHTICLGGGIELDSNGMQVAYWVNGTRVAAYGQKTKRRKAFMVYGTEKKIGEHRGVPILGIILQSLRETDRYRDSAQRKAVINSLLTMFIKRSADTDGKIPITGRAIKTGETLDDATVEDTRTFSGLGTNPGVIINTLEKGEIPEAFQPNGSDQSFGEFESAIMRGVAWALEMPVAILTLVFGSNYSASQAEINEYIMYLEKARYKFATSFHQPVYQEWLEMELISGRIKNYRALLDLLSGDWTVKAAWAAADWIGSIKPNTDLAKMAKGMVILVENGFMSPKVASRRFSGAKFEKNVSDLLEANTLLAEAKRPMLELKKEYGEQIEV